MTGKIRGSFFKGMLKPLLAADRLFPELEARVQTLNDDDLYDYEEYRRALLEIQSKLSPRAMVGVGFSIVQGQRERMQRQGFTTTDKILSDVLAAVQANVELPPEARITTVEYKKGRAVIEATYLRPPEVVEGILRGFASLFGGTLEDIEVIRGPLTCRFIVTWI